VKRSAMSEDAYASALQEGLLTMQLTDAVRVLRDPRLRAEHVTFMVLTRIGQLEEASHEDRDGWVEVSKRIATMLSVEETLQPCKEKQSRLEFATLAGAGELSLAMAENCIASPLFTKELQIKVILAAITARLDILVRFLARELGPAALLKEKRSRRRGSKTTKSKEPDCVFEKALQDNNNCFGALAEAFTDAELIEADAAWKIPLLHLACRRQCWRAVRVLLDRLPELPSIPGPDGRPALLEVGQQAPPEVYRQLVEGTPEELLLCQNEQGDTALHIAVSGFPLCYVKILLERIPPDVKAIQNQRKFTPLDLAQRRSKGQPHRGLPVQVRRDGAAIVALLAAGRLTKGAET